MIKKFFNNRFEILMVLFALIIRVIGLDYGLPYIYNTDEYKVVNYALKFGSGDLNPKFFEYPSLYLYFMFFVYGIIFIMGKLFGIFKDTADFAILYFRDPTIFYISARFFSVLFGVLNVILIGVLAKKLFGRRVAVLSMILFSVIPYIVEYCKIAKIEMSYLFVSLLFLLVIIKLIETKQEKYFYYSGILLGLGTSLKYIPVILFFIIFYANWICFKKFFDKKIVIVFLLFFIFFVIGTPFSILDFSTFLKDIKALVSPTISEFKNPFYLRLFMTFQTYLFVGSEIFKIPFLGILCYIGFFMCIVNFLKEKNPSYFLVLYPIVANFFIVARHFVVMKHFIFLSIPFFIICGAYILDKVYTSSKILFYILFIVIFLPSFLESVLINYKYSQVDTRTIALEWIEKNIPYGTKILIDRYPNSPPLKMTKKQLEKLYKKAVELNHYKKEYFYWQLKAHPGEHYGYEIYEVYHPPHEIGTIKHQVEEAQKVRELVDVSVGIDEIKKLGIEYFVYNSYSAGVTTEPQIKKFYQEIEEKTELITEFKPKTKFHPGPVIRIYKIE